MNRICCWISLQKLPSESVSQDWPFTAPPGFLFIETGNLRESGAFLKRYPTKFYHPNFDLVDVHWSPGNYIESMRREMCRISEMGYSFRLSGGCTLTWRFIKELLDPSFRVHAYNPRNVLFLPRRCLEFLGPSQTVIQAHLFYSASSSWYSCVMSY